MKINRVYNTFNWKNNEKKLKITTHNDTILKILNLHVYSQVTKFYQNLSKLSYFT